MTLPGLQVLLDDGTGTFPFDITSYVLGTDGYQITRGRDDWVGAVTAGQLTLTLNNSDGRFSPGSTVLGSPSPITVDAQIRVIEVMGTAGGWDTGGWDVGGWDAGVASFLRFTGYVKSWPVGWPATVTSFSTVQVTATDAQARAERRTLASMFAEEVLLDGAQAFYALTEPAGATSAGDTSGSQATTLVVAGSGAALAFGSSVFGSGGVDFSGGKYLEGTSGGFTSSADGAGVRFQTSATPASAAVVWLWAGYQIGVDSGGHVTGQALNIGPLTGPVVNDGQPHTAFLVCDGITLSLVVDAVVVATTAGAPHSGTLSTATLGKGFTGSVEWALAGPLTVTQATDVESIAAGTLVESATARLSRLASYAGLAVGTLDTSSLVVPLEDTTGMALQTAMQDVADAALGLIYVDGSGALTFHDGTHVASKTTPDLTLPSQYVTPDVTPTVDDQRMVNYVEATAVGTGATSVAQNQTSEDAHGRYPESVTYLVQTDAEALDRANWTIANLAEPTVRFGTLTINLYGMSTTLAQSVLTALDLDCWLRVVMLADQSPGGTVADVVVQGWTETVTDESWQITCNVVSRSLWDAFIADDPTYGIADSALARAYV